MKFYNPKGITFWFVIGKWGGLQFAFFRKSTIFRIVIGWVAFCIVTYDIEVILSNLLEKFREADKK